MTTERRCPGCSSLVRPDAAWCSLCHADLRSAEEKAAALPESEPVEALPALDPVRSPDPTGWADELAAAAAPGPRGRHARPGAPADPPVVVQAPGPFGARGVMATGATASTVTDADAALAKAGVDVQSMLSLLAAGEPDPLAPITGRLSSKGSRAVAATLATVALIVVGILTMFVLGSFVH